jgi:hypothetical protein
MTFRRNPVPLYFGGGERRERRRAERRKEYDYQTGGVISQKIVIFVVIAVRTSQV